MSVISNEVRDLSPLLFSKEKSAKSTKLKDRKIIFLGGVQNPLPNHTLREFRVLRGEPDFSFGCGYAALGPSCARAW